MQIVRRLPPSAAQLHPTEDFTRTPTYKLGYSDGTHGAWRAGQSQIYEAGYMAGLLRRALTAVK